MHDPDESRRRRWIRFPRGRVPRFLLVAGVAIAALAPAAWANHQFTDVPTASPHHADISTIARAGVTGGCGPGLYCPTQTVQRDQMASFIARTLRASTPLGRTAMGSGALDPDASPIACQTGEITSSVATVAYVTGHVSLRQAAAGELGYSVQPVISTDGGTTWLGTPSVISYMTSVTNGGWSNASQSIVVNLGALGVNPPTRIGMRVARESGTVDASDSRCRLQAQVTYSDAGPPSWGP